MLIFWGAELKSFYGLYNSKLEVPGLEKDAVKLRQRGSPFEDLFGFH